MTPSKPNNASKTTTLAKPGKATPATPAKTAPARTAPPSQHQTLTLGPTSATVHTNPDESKTLRLVRVIKAPADRIYKAFLDPDAMAKWLPPNGFTGKVHSIDAKVGGSYRMSFSTINRSWTSFFGGKYVELVPNKRIVHTDRFEDPAMPGEMTVTIDLKPVKGGTELTIVQAGIPKGPSADGAPYGWSQSLDNLANLCEAELPF